MASNQIANSPLLERSSAKLSTRSSEDVGNQTGFPGTGAAKASSLPEAAPPSLLGTESGQTEDGFHYEELPEFRPARAHMFTYGELGHTRMPSVTKVSWIAQSRVRVLCRRKTNCCAERCAKTPYPHMHARTRTYPCAPKVHQNRNESGRLLHMQQRRRSTGDFSAIEEAANGRAGDEGGKDSHVRGLRAGDSAHYSIFASSTSSSSTFLMKRSEDIPVLEEGLAGNQVSLDMKETSQCMRAYACDSASDP